MAPPYSYTLRGGALMEEERHKLSYGMAKQSAARKKRILEL